MSNLDLGGSGTSQNNSGFATTFTQNAGSKKNNFVPHQVVFAN